MNTNTKIITQNLNPRGYTIIVVLVIMILLSGLGILAINAVSVGVREAGLQKLNQEAFETANSSVNLFSQYAGSNAPILVKSFENDYNQFGRRTADSQANWAMRLPDQKVMELTLGAGASTSSPFANTNAQETWERTHPVDFSIVMRDLSDGIVAPGYSGSFCFKRVLLSAESTVGLTDLSQDNGTTFANATTAQETLIGPVRCNMGN